MAVSQPSIRREGWRVPPPRPNPVRPTPWAYDGVPGEGSIPVPLPPPPAFVSGPDTRVTPPTQDVDDNRAPNGLPRGRGLGLGQLTNGVEKPATSLTRSAWRPTPVFSKRRPRWVLIVVTATPRDAATSGTPPTSTMARRTRSSAGVSL